MLSHSKSTFRISHILTLQYPIDYMYLGKKLYTFVNEKIVRRKRGPLQETEENGTKTDNRRDRDVSRHACHSIRVAFLSQHDACNRFYTHYTTHLSGAISRFFAFAISHRRRQHDNKTQSEQPRSRHPLFSRTYTVTN